MLESIFYKLHMTMGWLQGINLSGNGEYSVGLRVQVRENESSSFCRMFYSGIFPPPGKQSTLLLPPSTFSLSFEVETKKNSPVKVIISRNNSFSDKPLSMKNIFFFVRFLDSINKKTLNTH